VTLRSVAALIGSPVAHSLSPVIHQAAFEAAGAEWTYVAFDVADGAAAVGAMRTLGIRGLSVTMPHKASVAAAVDRLDPTAVALGAVNTVSWDDDALVGSSTDGAGFVASLAEHGVAVDDATVVVIGAGGAARSIVDALGRSGAAAIVVVNRTAAAAEAAAQLSQAARVGEPADIASADIVVNATSLGMDLGTDPGGLSGAPMPCEPALLGPEHVVVDLVYHPLCTPWLQAAAAAGALTIDGLGMLIHQAALQQQRWTGRHPDVAVMRSAAEASLAAR
jgi:shikimate dehydrogenase